MEKLIFATGNEGKMKEIREILGRPGLTILSQKEAGIVSDAEENGTTFEANALIKARAVAAQTDALVLADDSGLEIDYLNGEPGVYSARYMGEDTPYTIKNQKILDLLAGVPEDKRTARFVCVIAAVLPDGREFTTKGTIEGIIGYESRGEGGFGYDPVFFVPELRKTFGQLTAEEKASVSHRGKALRAFAVALDDYLKGNE